MDPCPPAPILPPRRDRVRASNGLIEALLPGGTVALAPPVCWRPVDLADGAVLGWQALHSMEYLESVDDELFLELLLDWIDHVPPYRSGFWRHEWSPFAVSLRTVTWMQELVRRDLSFDTDQVRLVTRSIAAQIAFLEKNLELDIGGNHLIKNLRALFWAGRFFRGQAADRWTTIASRLLLPQLKEQIPEDGLHFERSPSYHVQVFADLLDCWSVIEDKDLKAAVSEALDRMAAALAAVTHPDGAISLFNDGGLSSGRKPETCLSAHARLGGTPTIAATSLVLADAGYYGVRSESDMVLVDCGAIAPDFLPAHGHGDILSFEWTVNHRRFIVDTGVFEYRPGPRRSRSRATMAHNTVTVDNADQCEFWSAFRVGRRARVRIHRFEAGPDRLRLEGSHDGYRHLAGRPIHTRRYDCRARYIEVFDQVEGGAGQPVHARLLLAPGVSVTPTASGLRLEDGVSLVGLTTDAMTNVVPAPWYPDFGVERQTLQIVLTYGPAPASGGFLLEVQ